MCDRICKTCGGDDAAFSDDADTRMELHRAAMELWEIAEPHMVGTEDAVRYMRARERHQIALSRLAGGGQND